MSRQLVPRIAHPLRVFVLCLLAVAATLAVASLVTAQEAQAIPFPISISSINPSSARSGTTVTCTVVGHFNVGSAYGTPQFSLVSIGSSPTITGQTIAVDPVLGQWATVQFTLPDWNAQGYYQVHVTQTLGTITFSYTLTGNPGAFQVLNPEPVITSITPQVVLVGSGDTVLTVEGNYFIPSHLMFPQSSYIYWDNTQLPTTVSGFAPATQLTATIPAADLATAGTAQITVHNIADGGVSNAVTFTVHAWPITLTGISPNSGVMGTTVQCTVHGTFSVDASTPAIELQEMADLNYKIHGTTTSWDATTASASFTLPADAPPGLYRLYGAQTVGSTYCWYYIDNQFTVTPKINITAPTAATSWPSGSTQNLTWTVSPAVPAGGEFRVGFVNTAGTAWYATTLLPAVAGKTSYAQALKVSCPAAVAGYQAYVYWRPVAGTGSYTATAKSAAFTVTPINISSPTAATSWPSGSTQNLTWTVNPAYPAGGEFKVGFIDATNTKWYGGVLVPAVAAKTSYALALKVSCPAGSGYRAYVSYSPTVVSPVWTQTARSAAFTVTPSLPAGWSTQRVNAGTPLNSVAFAGASDGWAVGNDLAGHGIILATTNGGASWSAQSPPAATANLKSITCANGSVAWAVADDGSILATTSGGASWKAQVPSNTSPSLYGVSCVNASDAWAVGIGGAILATTNGGATWTAQSAPPGTDTLNSVAFANPSDGWAVGFGGTILATTNGGATWTAQSAGTGVDLYGVACRGASDAWAVGDGGTILATTNGGATWSKQSAGTTANLEGVAFTSASNGWASGWNGTILATTNGGATWKAQSSGTGEGLMSVACANASDAWTVGDGGSILATTNGGAPPAIGITSPTATSSWKTGSTQTVSWTCNPMVAAGEFRVWLVSADNLHWYLSKQVLPTTGKTSYALSLAASVPAGSYKAAVYYRPTVGSGSWTATAKSAAFAVTPSLPAGWSAQSANTGDSLDGVAFANTIDGWAVGYDPATWDSVILATTSGGASWSAQKSDTGDILTGVACAGASYAWAVGYDPSFHPIILATTRGGASWSAQSAVATTYGLHAVACANPSDAWAVGEVGTILATTNGGATWSAQSSPTTELLDGVACVGVSDAWAVGSHGVILATTNGGATWSTQSSGTGDFLTAVAFANADDGWAVGYDTDTYASVILATTNGGAVWKTQRAGVNEDLSGVACADASHAWVVGGGSGGMILATTNGGSAWAAQYAPPGANTLMSVACANASDAWTVGDGGSILATTNGGAPPAIGITSPTATSSWKTGSTQTVSWTCNPMVAAGEFRVWLVSADNLHWYLSKQVLPTTGKTSYALSLAASVPAGSYKAAVYYRPTVGSGSWTATAKSAAFAVTL